MALARRWVRIGRQFNLTSMKMTTGAQPPVPVTSRNAALLNQQSIFQIMAIIFDTVYQQQKWYSKKKMLTGTNSNYSHDTYLINFCYWQWLVRLAYERGGFPGRVFILWSQKCSYRQRVAAFKGWCGVLYVLCDSRAYRLFESLCMTCTPVSYDVCLACCCLMVSGGS